MVKELFVYYDPTYDPECTTKFINPDISKVIIEFLKNKGFQVLNAYELRDAMLAVVKQEKERVVIVFAQDVAPDTVLDDHAPTALIRQFLDSGGSIVWVGDVPFYYQATGDGEIDRNWYLKGSPATMLGVRPTTALEIPKTSITRAGGRFGIQHRWTGIRPILADSRVTVLAEAKCPIAVAMYQLNRPRWWHEWLNKIRKFSLGTASFNMGVELEVIKGKQPNEVIWGKKLANAWFINFNRERNRTGFLRIWDYRPVVLSQQQLEDLHRVAIYMVAERKEKLETI
jgi:hypothetical protein